MYGIRLFRTKSLITVSLLLVIFTGAACSTSATAPPQPPSSSSDEGEGPVPTASPALTAAAPAQVKLDRVIVAMTTQGIDSNLSYAGGVSQLDKRPALEFLIGVDRNMGAYIPQLAEAWEMSPDGKTWTLDLREGVHFHDGWGEFTARDVRHSVFLQVFPDTQSGSVGRWRSLAGIGQTDTEEEMLKRLEEVVEIVDDHRVVLRLETVEPELFYDLSENDNLVMDSKARWDAGGQELYQQKVVGTGPLQFLERTEGVGVRYQGMEDHWRQTPEYRELEFRWVAESATRLATLLAGEAQVSDVDRALQAQAIGQGMKVIRSKLPSFNVRYYFGGLYWTTPDKLDPNVPFLKKEVREAMNIALNREAIANTILGGKVTLAVAPPFHPELDEALNPGVWNADWDRRYEELYAYNPTRARELLAQAGYPNGFEFTMWPDNQPGLSEAVDIAQAMALDWEAIGLKAKVVATERAQISPAARSMQMQSKLWYSYTRRRAAPEIVRSSTGSTTSHFYDHPWTDGKITELGHTVDSVKRAQILQEIGDHYMDEFAVIPMFWFFSEITVDPKYIADYEFPGTAAGFFTHLEYIKAAR
jgi:peptide/nickel transport system substrate-binding protein